MVYSYVELFVPCPTADWAHRIGVLSNIYCTQENKGIAMDGNELLPPQMWYRTVRFPTPEPIRAR